MKGFVDVLLILLKEKFYLRTTFKIQDILKINVTIANLVFV